MSGNLTVTEAFDILHVCRYCDSFTGDDSTGCSGRSTPCKHWCLDRITMPRWAAEYADLIDGNDVDTSWEPPDDGDTGLLPDPDPDWNAGCH